jgi:hypothetical protein
VAFFSIKEPNFFNADTLEEARARLEAVAPVEKSERWLLDGSVDYARYPLRADVPAHILRLCGAASPKFIYILRHPVDRAVSEYFWKRERYGEYRSIEEVMTADSQYVLTSCYDLQIERYFEYFGREDFHFVKFDAYFADPTAAFGTLCDWLGIDRVEVRSRDLALGGTDKAATKAARFPLLNKLAYASPGLRQAVKTVLPYRMLQKTTDMLSKPVEREEVPAALRARLMAEVFAPSLRRTEALTGLDLSDWI